MTPIHWMSTFRKKTSNYHEQNGSVRIVIAKPPSRMRVPTKSIQYYNVHHFTPNYIRYIYIYRDFMKFVLVSDIKKKRLCLNFSTQRAYVSYVRSSADRQSC